MKPDTHSEIPRWTWYTGSFLIIAERLARTNPASSLSDLFERFHQAHPEFPKEERFPAVNPGMVMMLLYGLVVVPREIWDTRDDFPFRSRQHFYFTIGDSQMSSGKFIRLLRNSVVHAHFKVNFDKQEYTFWNLTRDGQRDFEVTITHTGIGDFLTEVGKFYINYVGVQ